MPQLTNHRHERFAQDIAKGKNGADAHLAAGYALARDAAARNAYRLRSRQDIPERIDELAGMKRGRIAVEQVVESVRTGRPTLYRPELCELARRLALLGLKETEMADAFNVDVGTSSSGRLGTESCARTSSAAAFMPMLIWRKASTIAASVIDMRRSKSSCPQAPRR